MRDLSLSAASLLASASRYTRQRSLWLLTRKFSSHSCSGTTSRENWRLCLSIASPTTPCPSLTYSRTASTTGSSLASSTCISSCTQSTVPRSGLGLRSSFTRRPFSSCFWSSSTSCATCTCATWGSRAPRSAVFLMSGASSGFHAPTTGGKYSPGLYSPCKAAILAVSYSWLLVSFRWWFGDSTNTIDTLKISLTIPSKNIENILIHLYRSRYIMFPGIWWKRQRIFARSLHNHFIILI